jgi:hypothetical protein
MTVQDVQDVHTTAFEDDVQQQTHDALMKAA